MEEIDLNFKDEFSFNLMMIESKYHTHIQDIDNLLGIGKKLGKSIGADNYKDNSFFVIANIYKNIYNNSIAINQLLKIGLATQACILVRSMVEEFVNLNYIIHDSIDGKHKISERYLDYYKVVGKLYQDKVFDKLDITTLSEDELDERQKSYDEFVSAHPKYDLKKDWSGLDAATRAERGNVKNIYLTTFKIFSSFTHGAPEFKLDAKNILPFEGELGPSDDESLWFLAFFAVLIILSETVRVTAVLFNVKGIEEEIKNIQK